MACCRGQTINEMILAVLFAFGLVSLVHSVRCGDTTCPDNRPYCTPVGCVFQCPNESYADGRMCKEDCGVRYILNKQCVAVCPETEPFIQTKIVTIGNHFIKLQFCRNTCPSGTYVLSNTCVQSCPLDKKNASDGGVCMSSCPPIDRYKVNVTVDGQLTAIQCMKECKARTYILHEFCVNTCLPDQVVYEDECQGDCPQDAPYKDVKSGITFCVNTCGSSRFVQNSTCVSRCDEGLVSVKGVCSTKCPDNLPLKYKDDSGIVNCQSKCNAYSPGNLQEDEHCVTQCKHGNKVYADKCVSECPENAPVPVTDEDWDGVKHVYCRQNCNDIGEFVHKNTCVEACPETAHFLHDGICLETCPSEASYMCDKTMPECNCVYNQTICCITRCPYDTVPQNLKCSKPKEINCTELTPYHASNGSCVGECQPHQLIDGNKCIDEASCEKSIRFNGYCTDICPEGYLYQSSNPQCRSKSEVIGEMMFWGFCCMVVLVTMVMFLSTREFSVYQCLFLKNLISRPKQQASIEEGGSDEEPLVIDRA